MSVIEYQENKSDAPRECHSHEAQPSKCIKGRRDEEQIRTTQAPHTRNHRCTNKELQQRNRLGTVFSVTTSQQIHNVEKTSLQRRCNVTTLQQRCNDVVCMLD